MLLLHLGDGNAEPVGNSLYLPGALLEPLVERVGNSLNSLNNWLEKERKRVDAAQTTRKPLLSLLLLSMSSSRAATDESG